MKFTIRDLFLVTLVVALVVGWGLDHWRQATKIKEQAFWLEEWGTIMDEAFPPIPRGSHRFPQKRGDY